MNEVSANEGSPVAAGPDETHHALHELQADQMAQLCITFHVQRGGQATGDQVFDQPEPLLRETVAQQPRLEDIDTWPVEFPPPPFGDQFLAMMEQQPATSECEQCRLTSNGLCEMTTLPAPPSLARATVAGSGS